jgi:periplasmic divalent cation tolerance protein
MRGKELIIVVTSVGTEDQALDVAHALIRNRQAACVNIIPNVHSIYRWKGHVCEDDERLLIIKSVAREFEGIKETIQKVNTYELPEVLAYRVDHASGPFVDWIARMTDRPKRRVAPAARTKSRRSSPSSVTPLAG